MRESPHIGVSLRQSTRRQAVPVTSEGAAFPPRISRPGRIVRQKLLPCPEIDCVRDLLPPAAIAAAQMRAIEIGTGADRVLVSEGAISETQYVKALAFSLGAACHSLEQIPRTACVESDLEVLQSLQVGTLWLSAGQRRVLVIAPLDLAVRRLVSKLRFEPGLSSDICLTTYHHLQMFVRRHANVAITRKAVAELKLKRPDLSADTSRVRLTALPVIGGLVLIIASSAAPALVTTAVDVALAVVFLGWTGLRMIGALTPIPRRRIEHRMEDRDLPVYSIIVALYREAAVVEGLVNSLNSLDYPPEKLDIIFVLEPDDHETRQALAGMTLGPPFNVLTAATDGPRTKPKALNSVLPFARGCYVAVFDAEDRPESDQLRKSLQAFETGDEKLACVQARLCIDNAGQSWLTRMFAAEYAGLFDVFLPGLAALRLPLPLGGSSNHFRASVLRGAGAWDPYNVTEDADLGMRLARFGYHTAMINSTTYEEAPARLMPWIRQRTRWFKGWMQTWFVHTRHPLRLWRDLRPYGFLVFQLVVGGTVLAAMVHGIFAVALGWQIASGWLWSEKANIAETLVAGLHIMTLVSGYVISGILGVLGLSRRRMMSCGWALLLTPVYWFLLSIAAWRALFHLVLDPYDWEKTEHLMARASRSPPR